MYSQGTESIAIGYEAGKTKQIKNSIVINAGGTWPTTFLGNSQYQTVSGLYIRPIRGQSFVGTPILTYDTTTFEITYYTSSIKYKKNVTDLSENTSILHNIRAREYDTKISNQHCIGYIAEELNEISEWFTWKNPDGTPEGINWFSLLVYAIEEIKKLKKESITSNDKISQLETSLESCKSEIEELKTQILQLKQYLNIQ